MQLLLYQWLQLPQPVIRLLLQPLVYQVDCLELTQLRPLTLLFPKKVFIGLALCLFLTL
jgi:hypothetical protein